MALTDEQKEFIKYSKEKIHLDSGITHFKGKPIEDIFPEAFEPELVDFTNAKIEYGNLVELPCISAQILGIPQGHGLFFSHKRMKNPRLNTVMFDDCHGGWVLTFEKK